MLTGLIWLVCAVVVGLIMYFGIKFSRKQSTTWIVLHEGQFNRVKFEERFSPKRSAAAVYAGRSSLIKVAIIYFYDGDFCEAPGVEVMPYQRGTWIRVLQNGHGECRIEGGLWNETLL